VAAAALAFYCKEHGVLVLAALGLMFLRPGLRPWLRRVEPYAAAALFVMLIAPDVAWNAGADAETDRVTYGDRNAAQATYARHLQRVGGLGFSPYPLMFYGRSAVMPAYQRLTGSALDDNTSEYRSMHPWLGVLLLGSIAFTVAAARPHHDAGRFLLLYFGIVFVGFSIIRPGNPDGLDPVSWIWVDSTMLPAAVFSGAVLASLGGVTARRATSPRSQPPGPPAPLAP
jgi:4-amino-4-deoxy-L-arabinose transferase-like glycosyltransferase